MLFKKFKKILLVAVFLAVPFSAQAGGDCQGQWMVLPNHYGGQGAPCRVLGLDSHRGTCQPGNTYETLCDDTSGNRYKTCQGPRVCNSYGQAPPPVPQHDCSTWDFQANRPCAPGTVNRDCRSGCQSVVQNNNDCTSWDYQHNQPCPPGFINHDCHGNCGPR